MNFSELFRNAIRVLADMLYMTAPRQVIPGETCSVFRRISERRFLLRPDEIVNNVVEFCIGLAAQKHGILLHVFTVMTNHYHLQCTDPEGRRPDFMRDANRMIAQCLNRYWKREEALWSSDKPSVVTLLDSGAQLQNIIYITLNPVRAGLVSDYRRWPGALFSVNDWLRTAKKVKRPEYFFDSDKSVPEQVELSFVPPPAFANRNCSEVYAEVEEAIQNEQRSIRSEFTSGGRRFVGVKRVLSVNPFDRPKTQEPKNQLNPCLSASDPEVMDRAKKRLRYFRHAYREALSKLRQNVEAIFPYGTFWHRRFLNLPCEPAYTMQL